MNKKNIFPMLAFWFLLLDCDIPNAVSILSTQDTFTINIKTTLCNPNGPNPKYCCDSTKTDTCDANHAAIKISGPGNTPFYLFTDDQGNLSVPSSLLNQQVGVYMYNRPINPDENALPQPPIPGISCMNDFFNNISLQPSMRITLVCSYCSDTPTPYPASQNKICRVWDDPSKDCKLGPC